MNDSEFLHVNHVTVYTKEKELKLNPKEGCTLDTCHVVVNSIFAIWWKKSKGQSYWQGEAEALGENMKRIREDLVKNFSLTVSKEIVLKNYLTQKTVKSKVQKFLEFMYKSWGSTDLDSDSTNSSNQLTHSSIILQYKHFIVKYK